MSSKVFSRQYSCDNSTILTQTCAWVWCCIYKSEPFVHFERRKTHQIDYLLTPRTCHHNYWNEIQKKPLPSEINLHIPDVRHNLVNFIFKSLVVRRVYPLCLTPNDSECFADNRWYPFHTPLVQFWCIVYRPWWLEPVGLRCQFCRAPQSLCKWFVSWTSLRCLLLRDHHTGPWTRERHADNGDLGQTRYNSDERIGTVEIKTIGTMAWQPITC